MENCDGASLTAVRVIAAFYGLGVVLLVPVLVILRLVWYRRHNLLRDPAILERYGFIYEDFRSSALFYIVPQQAYKILLIVIKTAFWKYPLAQGWGGITVMLAAVWLHATSRARAGGTRVSRIVAAAPRGADRSSADAVAAVRPPRTRRRGRGRGRRRTPCGTQVQAVPQAVAQLL